VINGRVAYWAGRHKNHWSIENLFGLIQTGGVSPIEKKAPREALDAASSLDHVVGDLTPCQYEANWSRQDFNPVEGKTKEVVKLIRIGQIFTDSEEFDPYDHHIEDTIDA